MMTNENYSNLNEIQVDDSKRISSLSESFSLIPSTVSQSLSLHFIDSSFDDENPSNFSSSFTRKMSLSETDLLTSLHRTTDKFSTDQDSTDDFLFLDWDRERSLYQDYINSLRKEIRLLLQERLEYQNENSTISSDEKQKKFDLLQKMIEDKNSLVEQFQLEYEQIKEKNNQLIREISLLDSDKKSHLTIIDELKQKLTDFSIDFDNHVAVKQRLENSIENLENDCKTMDVERLKAIQDLHENQQQRQNMEKVLQKANVQIAEQGSFERKRKIFSREFNDFRFNDRNVTF